MTAIPKQFKQHFVKLLELKPNVCTFYILLDLKSTVIVYRKCLTLQILMDLNVLTHASMMVHATQRTTNVTLHAVNAPLTDSLQMQKNRKVKEVAMCLKLCI